jgi:ferredoxin-thioredoxin reductase catalytic subunit
MITESQARIEVESKVFGHSVQNGWNLNPNLKQLGMIYGKLAKNLKSHGEMYCPCCIVIVDKDNPKRDETNKAHICPCPQGKADIESKGYCKCRLFFKKKTKPAKG